MKKSMIIICVALAVVFISSCNGHRSPTSITTQWTPTPVCVPANVNYSRFDYQCATIFTLISNSVIKTETEYLANYAGFASGGNPTPTPVPIDFAKKMILGIYESGGCGMIYWTVTNISNDCEKMIIDRQASPPDCTPPGGPMCYSYWFTTAYYLVDRTDLPIVMRDTSMNCGGLTTVNSGPFIVTSTPQVIGPYWSTGTPLPLTGTVYPIRITPYVSPI
jgi:hypothetical protein